MNEIRNNDQLPDPPHDCETNWGHMTVIMVSDDESEEDTTEENGFHPSSPDDFAV